LDDTSDAPIIKLVNHIISQSIKARASDIHFEPYQNSFTVRYRVDGILYDLLSPPKWIQPALISRVKVMAKMNIAEKRLPQDGRFEVKIGDQDIDVRVSTIPTAFGERLVLRLLNKSGSLLELPDLGLAPGRLKLLKRLVASPNGIILNTGPTGSGKTTTLYAVLSSINEPNINIITIEDPIEYQIKGISQIQVNPKIDLTFARGLRSIVRQDPDVILVGEIRDKETAEIAVQSALTGHLVFSTLHTNDSSSAITRLVDMGVEPFLISSSVLAVVAQRLVRVLCDDCKIAYVPNPIYLQSIGFSPDHFKEKQIYKAVGCENCFSTGYRGRIGIFEIMVLTERLKSLILKTFDSSRIKAEAVRQKMRTLRVDGMQKVLEGITTTEEVLRVTQK
jgi:general secretion pathway protein E